VSLTDDIKRRKHNRSFVESLLYNDNPSPEVLPERSLLTQVLYRAVCDLFEPNTKLRAGARVWFSSSEETSEKFLTFRYVCVALNIDREWFLSLLLEAIEESKEDNRLVRKSTLRRLMTRERRLRLIEA
jgi:hypothetical protein